jgi:D-psicose/D-tagatose/L-ribulose 3-epimerase
MARLGLHTFAAAPRWDVGAMRALLPDLARHKVCALEIPLLDPAEIDVAATRAFCAETGIEPVCSLGLPASLDVIEDPDLGLAFLRPAFEVTRAVGARALSGVTYGAIGRTSGAPRTEAEVAGLTRFVAAAARLAAQHGLRLGIEPCNRYETHLLNTAAQARALCEAVGAANLFIHLDSYHMNIEEASFAEGFRDAGPFLGYVHLSESNRGAPGRGTVDWHAVFASLAEVGFDGIAALESMNHVHPAIARGLAIWRPVSEPPSDVIDKGLPFLHRAAEAAGFRFD